MGEMWRRWLSFLGAATFILSALPAAGATVATPETPIGRVKSVDGRASITTGDRQRAAAPGEPVYLHDVVETAGDGSLGIVFSDESRLSIGPDTRLTVDEYVFAPAEGEASFLARMARGTLLFVSGLIAKISPGAAAVETPVGTLGIRGTRFLVKLVPQEAT